MPRPEPAEEGRHAAAGKPAREALAEKEPGQHDD
jgi:hypothetical protein